MQAQKYEDDFVSISVAAHPYPDRFSISFDRENKSIKVQRLDRGEGWGQDLCLWFYDKVAKRRRTIRVGPSSFNVVSVSVDRSDDLNVFFRMPAERFEGAIPERRKAYICLATIPSRARTESFFSNLRSLVEDQTFPVEKVFVTVSDSYKRLGGKGIDERSLGRMRSLKGVEVITMEDLGPASKYLGPLIYRRDEIEGSLLVVVDDDRIYNRHMVRNFSVGFRLFQNMRFAAGDGLLYFRPEYRSMNDNSVGFEVRMNNHGFAGFYGFCIKVEGVEDIVDFHAKILGSIPKAFYHDDGMIRAYVHFKGEDMLMLHHKGPEVIHAEPPDALCQNGAINRDQIEAEMFRLASNPEFLNGQTSATK